jgi:hypothetical protein
MKVFVDWDTDEYSFVELGLPTIVDMPTMNVDDIADYLSDKYSYCVSSFKIIDLDSGCWHGEDAWVLFDDGTSLTILVGGHTLEVALEVKERCDADMPSLYDNYIVWVDAEEWVEQQEFA